MKSQSQLLLSNDSSVDIDYLIDQLKSFKGKTKTGKAKVIIETELDYGDCYYEGDTPETKAELKVYEV